MPTVTTNGTDLYYERSGHGPRLLVLLGSGSTIEGSRLMVDLFAPRFDLLVHDYRGMGRSAPVSGPYDMAACAADALAVMDAVGWDRARVAGISFGGMVAQELAVTAPSRVERLALLCTSPGGAGRSSYPLHELEGLTPEEHTRALVRLVDTRFDDDWLATHPSDRSLVELLAGRNEAAGLPAAQPGPADPVVSGAAEQLRARSHHDVWDRLGVVTCPTLVACGRYDGIAPPANSEAIASRLGHAELRRYEGGHAFLAQDPRSIPEIIGFLSESSPAPGTGTRPAAEQTGT